jgi:hypothetical protein
MEQVKIVFEALTAYGMYRDALYFVEGEVPPENEIERLKQERIDNWIAVVAPLYEMPTKQPDILVTGNYTDG